MCNGYLWRVLSLFGVCLAILATSARAEDLSVGIVAIQAGKPNVPQPSPFKGTGFLIEDGWAVTARHVIEAIDRNVQPGLYYVTLGSRRPDTNQILVTNTVCAKNSEIDICFLKLDDATSSLAGPLSKPFELVCSNRANEVAKDKHVVTVGFANNSEDVHGPVRGIITNLGGSYQDDETGIDHRNVVRTDAVTQSGQSGAPVVIDGTRKVIGVHTGLVGGVQVFAPLYELGEPVMFRGKEIACGARKSVTAERTRSLVMEYTGALASEPENEVGRLILHSVSFIRSRVRNLPDQEINFGYLDLVGADVSDKAVESLAQLREIWDNDASVMQILYGEFRPPVRQDAPFIINSYVFLGDLPAQALLDDRRNEFSISSSNTVSEFREIADGHHLVLLYAMILDAKRLNKPSHVVLGLISVSAYIVDSLDRGGLLVGDLGFIAAKIDTIRGEYLR